MKRMSFLLSVLAFGYAFLYIPVFTLIAYSFNDSAMASHWGGLSLRWYEELLRNDQIQTSLLLSVRIAVISATFATLLGTCAGLALARLRRFREALMPYNLKVEWVQGRTQPISSPLS